MLTCFVANVGSQITANFLNTLVSFPSERNTDIPHHDDHGMHIALTKSHVKHQHTTIPKQEIPYARGYFGFETVTRAAGYCCVGA